MNEQPTDTAWHIDRRCVNCDVARQLAPDLITEDADRSTLIRQPRTAAEERSLYAAAFACQTRSIRRGARGLPPEFDPFPLRLTEHVHLCGHNAPRTAGANSYLLRRPAGNLMMVDTPRWNSALAANTLPSARSPMCCSPTAITRRTAANTPTGSAPGCGSTKET